MAAAQPDVPLKKSSSAECLSPPNFDPLKQCSSSELLPPSMSELRVVLLGGSWSDRSCVGNFILGVNSSISKPTSCLKLSGRVEDRLISVINTPDLQFPTEDFIKDCVDVSDPGPHVFLLVLQPEDFTDEDKNRISTVLQAISDHSCEHSFILILRPRKETTKDLIKKCSYRYLMNKNTDLPELLTRFDQIVKENNGKYVSFKNTEETKTSSADQNLETSAGSPGAAVAEGVDVPLKKSSSAECLSPPISALRIVLLEKSRDKMTELINFMIREPELLIHKPSSGCVASTGQWGGKAVIAVKTPDMFSLSVENIRREVKNCMSLCPPGPNVLLLLVNPSVFTDDDRVTLKLILSLFGQDALKYSIVILTHTEERSSVTELLRDCGGRSYKMFEENQDLLMKNIEKIVEEYPKTCPTFSKDTNISQPTSEQCVNEGTIPSISFQEPKEQLNLVLFGRRVAEKTSAAAAILGQTDLYPASSPSESVKHAGEVCGRQVSVLELPPLYDKPQQKVMEESFKCVSLCDPEGVHAFILVLPVGLLTDEDKRELQTIQDTFSPRVKDFIMILFTVDSGPAAPAVGDFIKENREIQELCQSCGGTYVVLNIKDRQQIPELLESLDHTISSRENPTYTVTTLACGQMEEKSQLKAQLQTKTTLRDTDKNQKADSLRIVLIGRSGSGKSSSGNTILEKDEFEAQSSQQSVTKSCEKAEGLVDSHPVVVVDTPGLFDNSLSPEEVVKCLSLLVPGPHVFLLVFKMGSFSPEDSNTLKQLKKTFGDQSEKFTIILFTRGDELELEKKTIEEYIEKDCDDSFKKLMSDCGQRYYVCNNYDKQNRVQVRELMMKIDTMLIENRGSCYTSEKLQEAAEEKETSSKKMEEIKKDIEEKQKAWERERKELEENRRHEDQKRHEKQQTELKLQDELEKEIEKYEKQRKEEQKQEQEE